MLGKANNMEKKPQEIKLKFIKLTTKKKHQIFEPLFSTTATISQGISIAEVMLILFRNGILVSSYVITLFNIFLNSSS